LVEKKNKLYFMKEIENLEMLISEARRLAGRL